MCDTKQQINNHAAHHVCNYCAQLYSVGELALPSLCLFSTASLLHCRIWKPFPRWVTCFRALSKHSCSWKVFLPGDCTEWELGNGLLPTTSQLGGQHSLADKRRACGRRTYGTYRSVNPCHCSEHPLGVQVYLQLLLVRLVLLLTNGNCFGQAVCAHIQRCSKDNTPSLAEKFFPFHTSVGSIVIIGLILTFQYSIHHTRCICGSFLWQISCTT